MSGGNIGKRMATRYQISEKKPDSRFYSCNYDKNIPKLAFNFIMFYECDELK